MPKREKRPVILTEYGGYSLSDKEHSSSDKTFGYAIYKDVAKLNAAIERLWTRDIIPAKRQGLCAAIYTQLSDVQDETNGLVTYDRQVVKVNKTMLKKLNDELNDFNPSSS